MCKVKADEVLGLALGVPGQGPAECADAAKAMVATAFDEWMRRYIEHPEQFAREWQTVGKFLAEHEAGSVPTYGKQSAAYLQKLVVELLNGTAEEATP